MYVTGLTAADCLAYYKNQESCTIAWEAVAIIWFVSQFLLHETSRIQEK